MAEGKRYYGTCLDDNKKATGDKRAALRYEELIKDEIRKIRSNTNVKALVENYREELTGGKKITLKNAYDLSLKKPRKRIPGAIRAGIKIRHWQDFVDFMAEEYSSVTLLSEVQRFHAEAYIHSLQDNGSFGSRSTIEQNEDKEKIEIRKKQHLAAATLKDYQTTITEVFTLLFEDAGLIYNPFSFVPKPTLAGESREAFSESELTMIREKADPFTKPLFTIAMATALREGDICTLKWCEVDLVHDVICRQQMRKTKHPVEIPIMPHLKDFLLELKAQQSNQKPNEFSIYVLPEHAKMYLNNPSGVSYRIKQFLNGLGIETTRKPAGQTRSISVKDLHSCRHTFCYYAGMYGMPMTVVQSIVGHMTPEMTKLYSAHATLEDKRAKMQLMPDFMSMNRTNGESESLDILEIRDLLKQCPERSMRTN